MMNEREFLKETPKTSLLITDFHKVCKIIWKMKYWLIFSVVLFVSGAFFYLRYSVPLYQKYISVVINDQQNNYSNNYQLVASTLGSSGNSSKIGNQTFLLKSILLMKQVVERKNMNIRYFSIGRFIETEQYTNTPLNLSFIPEEGYENVNLNIVISFAYKSYARIESFTINGNPFLLDSQNIIPGEPIKIAAGTLLFSTPEYISMEKLGGLLRITRSGAEQAARFFLGKLKVQHTPQQNNVLTVSITDQHARRAEDILNIMMEEFNTLSKFYDSQGILNTISFLDERINALELELQRVEGSSSAYRSSNDIVDVNSQSQMAMSAEKGYMERLEELAMQMNLLGIIKESLLKSTHEMIPANIGINDVGINASIEQYNGLFIERNKLLSGSSESNPMVQNTTELLNSLKENIVQSVKNLEAAYLIQQESLTYQMGSNRKELVSMPSKQLALTRISRMQQIKEPLFTLLQQKREEALLTLSSLTDHVHVVDKALGSNSPIFPQNNRIYTLAILIGLLLPLSCIILVNLMRTSILSESDINNRCQIPILGLIPKIRKNRKLKNKISAVSTTGRDPLTESFRMLRAKLPYLNIKKRKEGALILQVTSSGPKEGKSFTSINLSLSIASMEKKVLLIGADLRKPSLEKYLGISRQMKGLSDYLAGNISDVHQIIRPYGEKKTIDILPAGQIPFNPSELLSSDLLANLLDSLRSEYDYIIIDSAPFLLVSDSYMISKIADCVLYVVRSGETKQYILDSLQNMYTEGVFNSLMIVLNGVNFKKNAYYGAEKIGYGYGYGYGHGAGYGYVDEGRKRRKQKALE